MWLNPLSFQFNYMLYLAWFVSRCFYSSVLVFYCSCDLLNFTSRDTSSSAWQEILKIAIVFIFYSSCDSWIAGDLVWFPLSNAKPCTQRSMHIFINSRWFDFREPLLDSFIVELWIHLLTEERQEITPSSLPACFVIAHSSGDFISDVDTSLDEGRWVS